MPKKTTNKIFTLISESKIIQIGIMAILFALAVTITKSDSLNIMGIIKVEEKNADMDYLDSLDYDTTYILNVRITRTVGVTAYTYYSELEIVERLCYVEPEP